MIKSKCACKANYKKLKKKEKKKKRKENLQQV